MLTPSIVLVVLLIAFLLWTPDWDRAVLESRYCDAPSDLMEVADVRLHFRDSGPVDAPASIHIHGFGGSLHTWRPWAQGRRPDKSPSGALLRPARQRL